MPQLNKLYYKARNFLVARFAILWVQTPWFKAILRTALMAYHDSPLYGERHKALGPKFAFQAFFDYGELSFWKWVAKKDGRMNWWKIVFIPFSVHQDARLLLYY
ncbi:MAG: hypothetical protein KAS36_07860 [Anaerolineales bacterium]|nr:hypothetical protein [Anaerolineales bacterium]